jgi:hypothetical protein
MFVVLTLALTYVIEQLPVTLPWSAITDKRKLCDWRLMGGR